MTQGKMTYKSATFSDVGRLVEFLNEREIPRDQLIKVHRTEHERWVLVFLD